VSVAPVWGAGAGAALDQEQLEAADVIGRRRVGRALAERGEPRAAAEMAALAMPAKIAGGHVFDHPLTQRCSRGIVLDVHRKLLSWSRQNHLDQHDSSLGPLTAIAASGQRASRQRSQPIAKRFRPYVLARQVSLAPSLTKEAPDRRVSCREGKL
jgi:hypothetical protein